jgi:hypothetical protein
VPVQFRLEDGEARAGCFGVEMVEGGRSCAFAVGGCWSDG